jgi:hypothetical protein
MQNQGIAQVEHKGRTQSELNVIRVLLYQDWRPGLTRFGVWRGRIRVNLWISGSFPGLGQAA